MTKGTSQYLEELKRYPDYMYYLEKLTEREQFVLRERLKGRTLEAVAKETPRMLTHYNGQDMGTVGVDRNRVRQIEAKACRKLIFKMEMHSRR